MEDEKMTEEDVIEEHNGIYGGIWHIVSPEGFNIPEGLEYLKIRWEGNMNYYYRFGIARTHRYSASIKVSGVLLKDAFKESLRALVKYSAHDTNLEIENCSNDTVGAKSDYLDRIMRYVGDFSVHDCQLGFEDLISVMGGIYGKNKSNSYIFSNNIFFNKTNSLWDKMVKELARLRNAKVSFTVLDLRGCNFLQSEKDNIMKVAGNLNILI